MRRRRRLRLGAYELRLQGVGNRRRPQLRRRAGGASASPTPARRVCEAAPERRLLSRPAARPSPASPSARRGSTTSTSCSASAAPAGNGSRDLAGARLLEPLVRLIFFGPLLMALGGPSRCPTGGCASACRQRARAAPAPGRRPNDAARALAPRSPRRCSAWRAAADPADRLADPGKEARARALFSRHPLPGLPERIDRRLRGRPRPRPAPDRARQVAAGRSDAQIRGFLVQRYGRVRPAAPAVLARPMRGLAGPVPDRPGRRRGALLRARRARRRRRCP